VNLVHNKCFITQIADKFEVTLFPIGGIPGGGVNNFFDYIKANPGKKSKEIKAALNLPQRTLERWLKELREQKKIKFQGPPKQGGIIFWMKLTPRHPLTCYQP
jgi:ATP-dependent DNA helicase RecG